MAVPSSAIHQSQTAVQFLTALATTREIDGVVSDQQGVRRAMLNLALPAAMLGCKLGKSPNIAIIGLIPISNASPHSWDTGQTCL